MHEQYYVELAKQEKLLSERMKKAIFTTVSLTVM